MSSEHVVFGLIWILLFVLVSGPVHEFAHAWTAWRLGDGTAKLFGRVTLNPIAHFDPLGAGILAFSVLFANFGFGWAKPTPVNSYNLRGRYGDTIVAAAGPISNLILAALFAIGFRILWAAGPEIYPYTRTPISVATYVMFLGVELNVLLAFFNLIPIPPLDGSHVLYDLVSRRTAMQIRPYLDQYGMFILILLIIPLGGNSILGSLYNTVGTPVVTFLLGV